MNREEYMKGLERALSGRVPEEELQNILIYYNEYFDEAGPQQEMGVIEELGSPEGVAARLLEDRAPVGWRKGGTPVWKGALLGVAGVAVVLFACVVIYQGVTRRGPALASARSTSGTRPVIAETEPAQTLSQDSAGAPADGVQNLEAFESLEIELGMGDVRVKTGTEYSVSLESSGMDKNGTPYELHFSSEDGALSVWSTPRSLNSYHPNPEATVVVTVPQGTVLEAATLEVGMGSLRWSDCGISEQLISEVGMGDADFSGDITGNVHVESGMGRIRVSGDLAGDVLLESGMGDIDLTLDGQAKEYEYELSTGMGTIRINGEKCSGTTQEGGGGDRDLTLSVGVGDISLDFGG